MFKIRVKGIERAENLGRLFEKNVNQAIGAALHHEASNIMHESKTKYVPVVSGELRSSGFVSPPFKRGHTVTVMLGFHKHYASRVHEDPRSGKTRGRSPSGRPYKEGTYSRVGQWKFLEIPFKQAIPGLPTRVGLHMRATLGLLGVK